MQCNNHDGKWLLLLLKKGNNYDWNKYLCVLHAWINKSFLCFLFCSDINSGLLCLIVHRIFIFLLFALLYVGKTIENPTNTGRTFVQDFCLFFIIVYFLLLAIFFYVMDFILCLYIMQNLLIKEEIYWGSICMIFVHYVNWYVPINLLYNGVLMSCKRPCCTNLWCWIFEVAFREDTPHFWDGHQKLYSTDHRCNL